MTEGPDNLVLQMPRRMDEKLDRVIDDVHDVKVRMTSLVESMPGVNRRLDRLEVRVERIERRLDLVEH
jgi:archaellum component FlaC